MQWKHSATSKKHGTGQQMQNVGNKRKLLTHSKFSLFFWEISMELGFLSYIFLSYMYIRM